MRVGWLWFVLGMVGCAGGIGEPGGVGGGDAFPDASPGDANTLPEPVSELPEGPYLRIAGADGGSTVRVGEDGLLRAEVVIGDVPSLRTVGLALHFEGAQLAQWQRDDELLTSNGGEVLQLLGSNTGDMLELVLATTAPVSVGRVGERLASLVLKPATSAGAIRFEAGGANRGLIAADGSWVAVTTVGISFGVN